MKINEKISQSPHPGEESFGSTYPLNAYLSYCPSERKDIANRFFDPTYKFPDLESVKCCLTSTYLAARPANKVACLAERAL